MTKDLTIGLVVPFATDQVPVEGPMMYPDVHFIPRGVGVRALDAGGLRRGLERHPAGRGGIRAKQGVDAIMVIGTSLTFYRGYEAHQKLLQQLREATGLPVSTMSEAVVDGLRAVGAKRIAVATAYADEVNNRLADFLTQVRLRGAGAGGLRPVRLRRARQQERERHHRTERQGDRRAPSRPTRC